MEFAFIIGIIGAWLIIALAKGADWLSGPGKRKITDEEILEEQKRSLRESRKWLDEHMPKKY